MDDLNEIFSTPLDNPLIPRFPIEMRNTEILTAVYRTDGAHLLAQVGCSRPDWFSLLMSSA